MGAFLPSASSTSLIIWPKTVSFPTFSVRTSNTPDWSTDPANTLLPTNFSTATASPVMADWLTNPEPLTRFPSTGIRSPSLTITVFAGLNGFYSGLDLFSVPSYKGPSRNRPFQFDDCRPSLVDRVSLYELRE